MLTRHPEILFSLATGIKIKFLTCGYEVFQDVRFPELAFVISEMTPYHLNWFVEKYGRDLVEYVCEPTKPWGTTNFDKIYHK